MRRHVLGAAAGMVIAAVSVGVLTTGCTRTVSGTAVRAQGAAAEVPLLTMTDLNRLLLYEPDMVEIVGTDMRVFTTEEELTYLADLVSEPDCVGAAFPLDEEVYSATNWVAARDTIFLEAADPDDIHVIEHGLVLFDTAEEATDFFEDSRLHWQECAGMTGIVVDDSPWLAFDVVELGDSLITQNADHVGYAQCQHALGVVANLIIESLACDDTFNDEAEKVVSATLTAAAQ